MTTENDDLEDREISLGKATVNNEGVPQDGFIDPELKYPKVAYSYESSVNKAARGGEVKNLSIKNGIPGVNLGAFDQVLTQYPLAQVDESVSGHVIEVNDTPGGERILIMHNSGAGVELKPDGTIVINSINNRVDVVGSDYRLSVEGDGDVTYFGNLNMTVTGDYNLNVKGNYNVNVGGNKILNVMGSYRKKIVGVMAEIVHKSKFSTILGMVTHTYLAGYNQLIKGNLRNHVDGEANYIHSGQTTITSEVGVDLSTPDANIAAENLSVFGAEGTIGGENIIMYTKNIYVGDNVETKTVNASDTMKAVTFHGSLKGTATASNFAKKAARLGGGSAPAYKDDAHNPDTTATEKPTESILNSYLNESGKGVRIVRVDPDNSIYDSIDLTKENGGISDRENTTREVRSKLKDSANLSNSKFIQNHISRGKLSSQYAKEAPSSLGRIRGKDTTLTTGDVPLGTNASATKLKRYRQNPSATQSKTRTIIPPAEYNPQFADDITMSTKLGPGVPISKFVSAYGDATTLNHITDIEERRQIARNLYPQAEVIRSFYNLEQFRGFNLVVAEGLYKPGPEEQSTPNEFNDLAQKGRVVAYEVYDRAGNQSFEKLYDLAVWLKDNLNYEKLSLYYDNFDPSGKLNGQMIITMPEISSDFSGAFNMNIETVYNGKVQSNSDLVEVLE